jgi:predicted RNA-binding protein associated with RNAse of E/G family
MGRWQRGDIIEYHHVRDERIWWRGPARVVEDGDDCLALWWPAGTIYQQPSGDDRSALLAQVKSGVWELADAEWWGGDCLLVIPPAAPFAIWPYRTHDGDLIGWYCNLQAPLVRVDGVAQTQDWILDVVASPDLSGWMWKDEDELAEAARHGVYSAADVARIRDAGAAVVSLIEGRSSLFERWAEWRPGADWPVPTLTN